MSQKVRNCRKNADSFSSQATEAVVKCKRFGSPCRPVMRAGPWANAADTAAMSNLRSQSPWMAEAPCTRARAVMAAAASLPPSGRRVGYAGGSVWPEPFCSLRPEFPHLPSTWQDRSAAGGAGLRVPQPSAPVGTAAMPHHPLPSQLRYISDIARLPADLWNHAASCSTHFTL